VVSSFKEDRGLQPDFDELMDVLFNRLLALCHLVNILHELAQSVAVGVPSDHMQVRIEVITQQLLETQQERSQVHLGFVAAILVLDLYAGCGLAVDLTG
jgi:hypothetical protein